MEIEVRKPIENELNEKGILTWPTWECDVSSFDWTYTEKEKCYLLEGEVVVKTDKQVVHIEAGDMVTFPAGLSCVWEVKQAVRKHYQFG